MEQIIAEDKKADLRLVLITFPDDGHKKIVTFNKQGEAVHLTIPELFLAQRLINQAVGKFLGGKV